MAQRKAKKIPEFAGSMAELADIMRVNKSTVTRWNKHDLVVWAGNLINVRETMKKVESLTRRNAPEDLNINEARAKHEQYKAALAKLDYEERCGALHPTESCQKAAFSEGRKVRDAMLNIPDRISSILAAETDELRVNAALKQEIRAALNEYAATG